MGNICTVSKIIPVLIIFCSSLYAASVPVYSCKKLASNAVITIDGNINEQAWQQAPTVQIATVWPDSVTVASKHLTEVKVLWDSLNLYLAYTAYDDTLWSTFTGRDEAIWSEEAVELFIDPDNDNQNYAEFNFNCVGGFVDYLKWLPGMEPITGWAANGMQSALRLHGTANNNADKDTSWTIEIALTWAGFDSISEDTLPPQPGDTMQVNFCRAERNQSSYSADSTEWIAWSFPSSLGRGFHQPTYFGKLVFSDSIAGASGVNQLVSFVNPLRNGMLVYPSIVQGNTELYITGLEGNKSPLTILSIIGPGGEVVKNLRVMRQASSTYRATWDGKNAFGRNVAAGIYFVKLKNSGKAGRVIVKK